MLFEMLSRLGYDWAQRCFHLSYGMVNLPSGKMKSREGTVVDADDLFDEMSGLAAAACAERDPELSQEELKRRGEIIGLGALKFMLLKFNPKTTMIFDPQASLRFEGDTGPYVQYVCARVGSIERKLAERNIAVGTPDWRLHDHPAEKDLAVKLFYYPAVLQSAGEKRDCSGVVDYLQCRRVLEAQKLLMQGCDTRQTAQRCGFHSMQHFYRVFKRVTGISPGSYRLPAET